MERRNTKQRQLVLDAVRSRCDHPSAEQIYNQVHKSDPKISVGTVYRNLNLLASEGQILAINLPQADRFDLNTEQHSHFICEECGRVFDVDVKCEEALDDIKFGKGFIVHSRQTVFKGLCNDCAKKINKYKGELK